MIFEFKSKGRIQDTTTSSSISERRNMLLVYDSEKRIFNVFFVVERSGTSKTHLQAVKDIINMKIVGQKSLNSMTKIIINNSP